MTEYSKIARGSFTTAASPVTQFVNLPFQPTRVELKNITAYRSPAQNAVTSAFWDISMGQGTAVIEYIESAGSPWILAADSVVSGGISTFSAGLMLQYGPAVLLGGSGGITKNAGAPQVTTTSAHGLSTGDVVIFENLYQSTTTGMQQIAGIPFKVTVTGSTTFTIIYDNSGSNFTAITSGGLNTAAQFKKVLYPDLYLPGVDFISAINTTTGLITTTTNHNFVVGQEIAFRIPSAYGSVELNSLPDVAIPGSPIYFYVAAVNSNTTFTIASIPSSVTAFNPNQTFASFRGLQFAQVLAVGDVNTGGAPITATSPLYPSPSFPTFTGGVPTINGPAIQGAFVNNTRQGFSVGLGVGVVDSSALLLTASSLYVWTATYFDIG